MTCLNRISTVLVLFVSTTLASYGQIFTTLDSFDGANGAQPAYMSFVQGRDGDLYGTTRFYGAYTGGTIFKITPTGVLTTVHNFCAKKNCTDGGGPIATLLQATDGNFYGTTFAGGNDGGCGSDGCGTVFKLSPSGNFLVVHRFAEIDGAYPFGPLAEGFDGNLYGTTSAAGPNGSGGGTVFQIDHNGILTTIRSFCDNPPACSDGAGPRAGLILATDGNFYGTTIQGGRNPNDGTVFRITPSGNVTTLHSFEGDDGTFPDAALLQASDGNLYGTTTSTVFKMTSTDPFSLLYRFCSQSFCNDGTTPYGSLIEATDGNFYGTTSTDGINNAGTIFQLTRDGTLTTLYSFCSQPNCADGSSPYGGLFQSTNGIFYGTTGLSGQEGNYGTVFSLDMGLSPFVAFVRGYGRVGQTGGILGQGFTGTTSVMLNGVPAAFTLVSDTYLVAAVPPGASTGYVTVTTPSGTLRSNKPFIVLP